jgi:membrane fusion protein (multidrug efflux system)
VAAGSELSSAAAGLRQLEALTAARVAEAQAHARAARAAAVQADKEIERAEQLLAAQLTSLSEVERLRADADRQRAEAEAADRMVDRLRSEAGAERQERLVELAALEGAVLRLRTEIESAAEEVGARSAQADRFTVRAPFAGRVGEVAVRRSGAVVAVGEALATLVPDLDVQAVAFFRPVEALGRIRPGQPAELRLEAFPWTEYGSIAARVVAVEEATLEERVRVELVLVEGGRFDGPRDHGMRATALIETERRSPLHLLVRGLSRPWGSPAAASPGG